MPSPFCAEIAGLVTAGPAANVVAARIVTVFALGQIGDGAQSGFPGAARGRSDTALAPVVALPARRVAARRVAARRVAARPDGAALAHRGGWRPAGLRAGVSPFGAGPAMDQRLGRKTALGSGSVIDIVPATPQGGTT